MALPFDAPEGFRLARRRKHRFAQRERDHRVARAVYKRARTLFGEGVPLKAEFLAVARVGAEARSPQSVLRPSQAVRLDSSFSLSCVLSPVSTGPQAESLCYKG